MKDKFKNQTIKPFLLVECLCVSLESDKALGGFIFLVKSKFIVSKNNNFKLK